MSSIDIHTDFLEIYTGKFNHPKAIEKLLHLNLSPSPISLHSFLLNLFSPLSLFRGHFGPLFFLQSLKSIGSSFLLFLPCLSRGLEFGSFGVQLGLELGADLVVGDLLDELECEQSKFLAVLEVLDLREDKCGSQSEWAD